MSNAKNTVIDFELNDGSTVKMTLMFYALYQLKAKNKAVYDRYNKIMVNGPKEELDNALILYAAYLCANISTIDDCMSEVEFLKLMPIDREKIGETLEQLIKPKKK